MGGGLAAIHSAGWNPMGLRIEISGTGRIHHRTICGMFASACSSMIVGLERYLLTRMMLMNWQNHCANSKVWPRLIIISTEIARRNKCRGHTNNLWSVVPRIFYFDSMCVESIHIHILAVMKLIACPISCTVVIAIITDSVLRVDSFFRVALVVFSSGNIWLGYCFFFIVINVRKTPGLINKVKK